MPRPRLGALPMTAAERQARRRAKLRRLGDTLTRAPMPRGLPRPRRWAAAVTALMALQDEYRAWLDRLPESLAGSKTADNCKQSPSSTSTSCSPSSRHAATAAIDAPDLWGVTARSTARWGLDERLPLDQNRLAMQLAFVSAAKIAATLTPALWVA